MTDSNHTLASFFRLTLSNPPKVLLASEGVSGLLSYSEQDLISGRISLQSQIHSDDQDLAAAIFSTEEIKTSSTINIRIRHANGKIKCLKGHYRKELDPHTLQLTLELLLQDAKTLKQDIADQSMLANFTAMMENTDDYIYFKDRNHVFTGASQTLVSITDPSEHWTDLIGLTDYDVFPEAYADEYYRLEKQVFAGLPVAHEIQETLDKQGNKGWVDNRKYPIKNNKGDIIGLFGIARVITQHKLMEDALRQSEQRFRMLFNNSPDPCWLIEDYLYVSCNVAALHTLGYANVGELLPVHPAAVSPEHQADGRPSLSKANAMMDQALSEGILHFEWLHRRKDGHVFPAEVTLAKISIDDRDLLFCQWRDITERKRIEEKLKLSDRVFREAREGISITDANAVIVDVNPTFCAITGYNRAEVLGKNPRVLASGHHSTEFYTKMWQALLENNHWQGEIWNRRKNGEVYAEYLTISTLRDTHGHIVNYIALFSDITHIKHQQQALESLAHYDPLTKLPNRTLFADRFLLAMARCKRENSLLALGFLDLDGFKPVNDEFGHQIGDQILIEVANRIKATLREEDTISRQGGDEFVLLLGNMDSVSQCEQAMQRIHHTITQPYFIDQQAVSIGVSSGMTVYPRDDADLDTLIRHADHAMYQAKLAGKNRSHLFDASRDRQLMDRHDQLRRIEEAYARQEFCLYYQPKVDMRSGKVIGAEALIRWQDPQRGLTPPSAFLPLIESTELEIKLGNWVIEQALQQMALWKAQGLTLQISVNISSYHLLWPGFFKQLHQLLNRYPAIDSNQLQLEMLESSALGDLNTVGQIIDNCRNLLGVCIALDDFGTGYSSLTHLRHLSADTVKIDQGFVRDMLDDPDDYAIIEAVIGLSQAFRREVIAEGVESPEHGLLLLMMGCHLAQGYGIARPMPPKAVSDWINTFVAFDSWLSYTDQPLTEQQAKIALLKIENQQWLNRMQTLLQAEQPGEIRPWPIMDHSKCHCGRWLKDARGNSHFTRPWLEQLDQLHRQLHQIGRHLMQQFEQDTVTESRFNLEDLQNAHQAILCHLENSP